jgi:hypothetical protein
MKVYYEKSLRFTLGGRHLLMFPVITKKSSVLLQYCISTPELLSVGQDVNQFAIFLK